MALTITARDVYLEAPELECNAIPSDVMARAIEQVALEVSDGVLGLQRANRIAVLLVAHRLTLWKQRKDGVGGAAQAVGPVTSVSVGGVSKSFASSADSMVGSDKLVSSTSYGREYARLKTMWAPRGFTT